MASAASLEEIVDAATSGHGDDWGKIMSVCDEINRDPANIKKFFPAIWRKLKHQDPHVVLEAITLLNACVKNCGKTFHQQIATRDFEKNFTDLLNKKTDSNIRTPLLSTLRQWAEGDFAKDPKLNLIPSLFLKLRREGYYTIESQKVEKPVIVKKEADMDSDLAQAIELSLQEEKKKSQGTASQNSSSLYPTSFLSKTFQAPEGRKVRALYDFVDAEEGELSFKAGEIITIIDESDSSWWKGYNKRGEGLLPANFVTSDLSVESEQPRPETKRTVQFDEQVRVQNIVKEEVEIDEKKMDLLLHYLHEADPTDPTRDPPEMRDLADEVNAMGPLIDAELERVDSKHAQLNQLCMDLQRALTMYNETLMRDPNQSGLGGIPKPMGHHYPMPPQAMNGPVPGPSMPSMMHHAYASLPHHPPPNNIMNGPPTNPSFIPDPTRHHNGPPPVYGLPPGPPQGVYPMPPMSSLPGASGPPSHPSYQPPLL